MAWLWARAGAWRVAAIAVGLALANEGAGLQWRALAAQLGNAL
jgi:hypothetical protein